MHFCQLTLNVAIKHQDVKDVLNIDPNAKVVIEIPIGLTPGQASARAEAPTDDLVFDLLDTKVGLKTSTAVYQSGHATAEIFPGGTRVIPVDLMVNGHSAASADTDSISDLTDNEAEDLSSV